MFFGGPLLLGSAFGLFVGLALVVVLVIRIHVEEKLLAESLPGYAAYRRKVRFRLLPGIF
jgi:protein-S-isoprenylcysteine O-methyltransferase Ste14